MCQHISFFFTQTQEKYGILIIEQFMKTSSLHNDRIAFLRMIGLCFAGLLLNLVLSKLIIALHIPIFLDSIGTLFIAVLCGTLPGMSVGFLTNAINSITDPITLYYGILSVFIAFTASLFSKKGKLKTVRGCFSAACCFAFIGGAVGSCMTWMLYGGGIGEGISAPFAKELLSNGVPLFWAQFAADVCIDLADKIISILPVYLFLRFYPKKLYGFFPYSHLYYHDSMDLLKYRQERQTTYRKASLNIYVIRLITVATILVSGFSIVIGTVYYQKKLKEQYTEKVYAAASLAAGYIDATRIDEFIKNGRYAHGYMEIENNLYRIYNSIPGLAFIYVYRFTEKGNYVVFDLNVPAGPADAPGALIPFDETLAKYRSRFLSGQDIRIPMISHDKYGWICTSCCAIRDAYGRTQAYACADITLAQFKYDMLTFVIRLVSLLFGITVFVAAYVMWYAQHRLVNPINDIALQSQKFNHSDPELWLMSDAWLKRKPVHTGDEIEELYNTVCEVEEHISRNVAELKETQRKLLESEQIEKKNRELAQAVKRADDANNAKTMFLSNISHDMRTPLNSVIGFTRIAAEAKTVKEKDSCLEKIRQSAEYLLGLINDTLDLSRMETGKVKLNPKPFSGEKIFSSVLNCNQAAAAKKHITIQADGAILKNCTLFADEMRLEEILNNIVGNSIKFTPEGGLITLRAESSGDDEKKLKIRFCISDTGIGMSEAFIPHAFEPFTQENPYENRNYTGSGLGLSIVKNIVDMMGGTIHIESRQGKGTEFIISLDIPKAQELPAAAGKEQISLDILKNCRILLCEDHPLNIELAVLLLEKQGMIVETAVDGRKGADLFRTSPLHHFDAVLMDIRMPVMDGIEAARQIRSSGREDALSTPIIAMTANAFEEDRDKAKAAGMNAYIAKPIDPDALYAVLSQEIQRSRA